MTTTHLRAEAESVQHEAGDELTTRAALLLGAADTIDALEAKLATMVDLLQISKGFAECYEGLSERLADFEAAGETHVVTVGMVRAMEAAITKAGGGECATAPAIDPLREACKSLDAGLRAADLDITSIGIDARGAPHLIVYVPSRHASRKVWDWLARNAEQDPDGEGDPLWEGYVVSTTNVGRVVPAVGEPEPLPTIEDIQAMGVDITGGQDAADYVNELRGQE